MQNHLLDIIDDSTPSIDTPLIFNNNVNTSGVKNLLLIDSIVSESQLFFDSSNSNTFPIIYSNNSNREDFMKLLEEKFSNGLERIAFVFHDNIKDGKTFLNQELFFSESDIQEKKISSYSPNTQLLIDVIKKFGVKSIDFLACNSLNYGNWVNFYELLRKETNVIVGASNDKTGNLKHGGDWVMENTNENVVSTYFNSNIENYSSTLAVTITKNGGFIYIYQIGNNINYYSDVNNNGPITSWPVTFVNSNAVEGNILTILITTNLTISNATVVTGTNGYFITGSNYITYDGTGKTITISNVTNYPGLIQNGSISASGYSNITVKNINNAISGSSTLAADGGWICQSYFGKGVSNNLVDNCYNSGAVNNIYCGGICGRNFAQSGNATIKNCSNTGFINNSGSGGICGGYLGNNNGIVSIINCSNIGAITSQSSGGICGSSTGNNLGKILITRCSNTGIISGNYAGGICGDNGTVSLTSCSNTGIISGTGSGGIVGDWLGYNSNNLCSIINCYNRGNITGNNAGGITGSEIGYNNNANPTYTPNILIQNCYSLGNIGTTCGGICGGTGGSTYTNTPIVNITNCYTSYNTIADSTSQYISNNLQIKNSIVLTNVYTSLTNNWSDNDANNALIETAQRFFINSPYYLHYSNVGEVWYSNQENKPFVLASNVTTIPRRKGRRN